MELAGSEKTSRFIIYVYFHIKANNQQESRILLYRNMFYHGFSVTCFNLYFTVYGFNWVNVV